jgi:predicted Zn-dependent protease with MMP-like domain
MFDVSEDRFEELVVEALEGIPEAIKAHMANVALFIEDNPPTEEPHLLGLYDGIPLTERGDTYSGVLPDRILVFRNPLVAACETEDDLLREVRITVVHEIAHHFGIHDDRLDELGYA